METTNENLNFYVRVQRVTSFGIFFEQMLGAVLAAIRGYVLTAPDRFSMG